MCLINFADIESAVKIYQGVKGVKTVYGEIFQEKKPLRGYTHLEALEPLFGEAGIWGLAEQRSKNGIFFYCIAEKGLLAAKAQARSEQDKREIKFVEGMIFGTETFIAENRIYTLDFVSPCGLIISSSAIAKTQGAIWQSMWDRLQ